MERRLGRGLGALLGEAQKEDREAPQTEVEIAQIRPNPHQPRRQFEPASLEELRASIARHGILQPICVRSSAGGYEIIAGERRYRAARLAGLTRVPVVVRTDVGEEQMLELALVENLQREDLDPIEKARGFREMADRLGLTQEQVAERVGLKRATVTNHLRLLELPDRIQEAVRQGLVSMGHARALLAVASHGERLELLALIVREGLSVRQVEALAKRSAEAEAPIDKAERAPGTGRASWIDDIEDRLRKALGTKVTIQNGVGYRGRIVIEYYERDGLDRLIERLGPSTKL